MSEQNEKPGGPKPTFYVGVGASAGGLEAIETFFGQIPENSGLAYVVVQHLSPDYKSLMVELLSKKTALPVYRAEDNMVVSANCVYLIPPKKNLTIFHGSLLLSDQDPSRGINLPIDIFFRSLAEDQGERAVGVVLSGTGSDGMRGVRSIKEHGGMVMVQEESTARFDGMPRAAISTGLADFVLPPESMSEQLLAFAKHPGAVRTNDREPEVDGDELTRIFATLREECKVDFTYYKQSTVLRRIDRRISVNQLRDMGEYASYLRSYPQEVNALYRELLIGVTSFFRDRETFEAIAETYLPELLRKDPRPELRFWIAGCSTGEEAYTFAIITREVMETLGLSKDVKIFATDIDRDAIVYAQSGTYPESIAADLSPRLLSRYFYRKDDNFQIVRNIREMVVFAQHNLLKAPPFTNIDLVSCRNLLIYLQAVLQKRVLELFNFSLNAGGLLVLGTSETIGEMTDYFDTVDRALKLYRCRGRERMLSADGLPMVGELRRRGASYPGFRRLPRPGEEEKQLERLLQTLAEDTLPLTLVVNEHLELLHLFGEAEGFFKLPSGRLLNDVSKMANKDLAIPITINLRIKPLPEVKGRESLVLVLVDELPDDANKGPSEAQSYDLSQEAEQHIRDLEQELQFTRENLQATIEELETANEELQATNEELLASNEELQSTNEELQSTNEELHTVNAEYQNKIIELTELSNDVNNLLDSSDIAQLLLDEDLEIRRFSPRIREIFKILDSDIGRPLTHLSCFLGGVDPIDVARKVLRSGEVDETNVCGPAGRKYLMRTKPYQIGPEAFSGVIMTFVEVSAIHRVEQALANSERDYRTLFDTMAQGVVYQNERGEIVSANPAAERLLGMTLDQMRGASWRDPRWSAVDEHGDPLRIEDHPATLAFKRGRSVEDALIGVMNPLLGLRRWLRINATPLYGARNAEKPDQVYSTFEDVTERVEAERDLRLLYRRLDFAFESADLAWWDWNVKTGAVKVNRMKFEWIGFAPDEVESTLDFWTGRLHPEDYDTAMNAMRAHFEGKAALYDVKYRLRTKDDGWRWLHDRGRVAEREDDGAPVRVVGTVGLVDEAEAD
jgi:two-component system CheB/CheR fusion protein